MGLFDKMFSGLSKTRNSMQELEELFQGYQPDSEEFYEDLEELLVLADVGASTAQRVDYLMRRATWTDRYRKGQRGPGRPDPHSHRPAGRGQPGAEA